MATRPWPRERWKRDVPSGEEDIEGRRRRVMEGRKEGKEEGGKGGRKERRRNAKEMGGEGKRMRQRKAKAPWETKNQKKGPSAEQDEIPGVTATAELSFSLFALTSFHRREKEIIAPLPCVHSFAHHPPFLPFLLLCRPLSCTRHLSSLSSPPLPSSSQPGHPCKRPTEQ